MSSSKDFGRHDVEAGALHKPDEVVYGVSNADSDVGALSDVGIGETKRVLKHRHLQMIGIGGG